MNSSKMETFLPKVILAITIFAICIVRSETSTNFKTIQTRNGKVRGIRKTTLIHKVVFYSFKGIPYAKSPTGELRFKAPEPVESWTPAEHSASEHGNTCVQRGSFAQGQPQDEDCLFLNVYVPADVKANERLAVLLFIHGGAFSEGSGNDFGYGPDFIIEQRAILVTFNYRLGVFGFLSLNSTEYSGNMGLKDQQLALKWVHSNIENFSGDNQRIMLFGQSSGAVSAHFHVLSRESRKYFRNAVLLSGSAENFWALSQKHDHLDLAFKIAKDLNQPKQTFEQLVELMHTVPADKIVSFASSTQKTKSGIYIPVIESEDAVRPFIVDLPSKIYDDSEIDVDIIFSLCSAEFMLFYREEVDDVFNLKRFDRNFTLNLPFREINITFDSPEYQSLAKEIRAFYFKDAAIDQTTLKQYLDLLSDAYVSYHIDKSAKEHALKTNSKPFYLRFSMDSKLNVFKRLNPNVDDLPGAGHGDEICYIFRCQFADGFYDEILQNKENEEFGINLRIIDDVTKLLTNFAKYGEPTHRGDPVGGFLPIQKDRVNFLDVTNEGLKTGVDPNQKFNRFWARIEEKVYHHVNI